MPIQKPSEFHQYINQLANENIHTTRTLQEYLQALLHQIQLDKDKQPSYQDIADYLRDALTGDIAVFSKDWAKVRPQLSESNSPEYFAEIETFEYLERRLQSYIAQLESLRTSIGFAFSPNYEKHGWYNTSIPSFLCAGVAIFDDYDEEEGYEKGSWQFLGSVLRHGKSDE